MIVQMLPDPKQQQRAIGLFGASGAIANGKQFSQDSQWRRSSLFDSSWDNHRRDTCAIRLLEVDLLAHRDAVNPSGHCVHVPDPQVIWSKRRQGLPARRARDIHSDWCVYSLERCTLLKLTALLLSCDCSIRICTHYWVGFRLALRGCLGALFHIYRTIRNIFRLGDSSRRSKCCPVSLIHYLTFQFPPDMPTLTSPPKLWFYPNFAVLFGTALMPFFWYMQMYLTFSPYWQEYLNWSTIITGVKL
jgi:hypothetical protein